VFALPRSAAHTAVAGLIALPLAAGAARAQTVDPTMSRKLVVLP
jgi:hypothetical protein